MERRLDDFELGRRLGAGAFGEVHVAFDRKRNARVALKRLRHGGAIDLYRFKKEFRAIAGIFHPNVVSLHELFRADGDWFIAMELVEGIDIVRYAREGGSGAFAATVMAEAGDFAAPAETPTEPKIHWLDASRERLRESFAQLATGVGVLHDAKRVHRDLKPSNVLVARDGTVKILDFGLVTELAVASESLGQIVGTPAYMAPEQGRGQDVTAAADWYSVGALLYEALIGRPPFDDDDVVTVLAEKNTRDPVDPREFERGLPDELCELSMRLLDRNPAARPTGHDVIERLGAGKRISSAPRFLSPAPQGLLIGRDAELKKLGAAFEASRGGRAVTVHVHGASGNGKSALLRAFVQGLEERGDVMTLEGRCHEGEGAAFKAVDTIMDAATSRLARARTEQVERILPRDFAALTRLFPVLQRLAARARTSIAQRDAMDPLELRRRAFTALRDMFGRIAEEHPVVVCIDDLQWGDADSVSLLAELVREPDAPAMLLVLSYRSEDAAASTVLRSLAENVRAENTSELAIGPLSHADAASLAQALLASQGTPAEADVEAIARESGGNPLFVQELARHALEGAHTTDDVSLDHLIAQRIDRLPEAARSLLEVAALAFGVISVDVLRAVTDLPGEVALSALAHLRSEHLVRMTREREREVLETYHDRIRQRMCDLVDRGRARQWHGLLAAVLEGHGEAEDDVIAFHYMASDHPERALPHAERAALAASRALAFDRAAELYRTVVELTPAGTAEATRARIMLGDALVHAGRGIEAADVFIDAAEHVSEGERVDLWRRAAEQLLFSGDIERGMSLLNRVLSSAGMSLGSRRWTMLALIFVRVLLTFRGTRASARPPNDRSLIPRLEACNSTAEGLVMIDHLQAVLFAGRALLLALRAGDPVRLSRALIGEANLEAHAARTKMGRARAVRLHREGDRLARETANAGCLAFSELGRGTLALTAGNWVSAVQAFDRAAAMSRRNPQPDAWTLREIGFAEGLALTAEVHLGQYFAAAERRTRLRRDAIERGDLFLQINSDLGYGSVVALASDEPSHVRFLVKGAMARWSTGGYSMQRWYALMALTLTDLYEGNARGAARRLERGWARLLSSGNLLNITTNVTARALRALVHLSHPDALTDPSHVKIARLEERHLARSSAPWTRPTRTLVRGALASLERPTQWLHTWCAALEQSATEFDAHDMRAYASAARYRLGMIRGGGMSDPMATSAAMELFNCGALKPESFVRVLIPGLTLAHDAESGDAPTLKRRTSLPSSIRPLA